MPIYEKPQTPDYVRVVIMRKNEPRKAIKVVGTDYLAVINKIKIEISRSDIALRFISGSQMKIQARQCFEGKINGKTHSVSFYSKYSVEDVFNHLKQLFDGN